MEEKVETNKQKTKVLKRIILELRDDKSIIMRQEGLNNSDKAIELLRAALNNIFGEPMVIITEKDNKKIKSTLKMTDEKIKELSTLTNFINTLILLKKIGILNKDVLQTLREMRITTTLLTPKENEEMNTESAILFKKMKEEDKAKKLFSKYSGTDLMYG
jgi:hypothetical protein